MEFCEKLVRLRKTKHMTQDDLADALHISRQAVYKWECGQSYPEAMKLVALKELFGISIDLLLDPTYEVPAPVRTRARKSEKVAIDTPAATPALEVVDVVSDVDTTPVAIKTAETPTPEAEKTDTSEPVATPVPEVAPVAVPQETPLPETKTAAEARPEKRGFFARLFGRK